MKIDFLKEGRGSTIKDFLVPNILIVSTAHMEAVASRVSWIHQRGLFLTRQPSVANQPLKQLKVQGNQSWAYNQVSLRYRSRGLNLGLPDTISVNVNSTYQAVEAGF